MIDLPTFAAAWKGALGRHAHHLAGFVPLHERQLRQRLASVSVDTFQPLESAAPARDDGSVTETKTRHMGTCAVCEAFHKLSGTDKLVHHAYTRPGDGHILGGCFGVGKDPYEVSCDATKEFLAYLEHQRDAKLGGIADLEAGRATEIRWKPYTYSEEVVLTPTDPDWPRAVRMAILQEESGIRALEGVMERLRKRIAAWKPGRIKTVEEIASATASERKLKSEKRRAEREERLAAKVASYQRRLEVAVRNRTASTIADIFESAPQKLMEMAELTRQQAHELLDRSDIFRAFGLDPTRDAHAEPNNSILGWMRYDFDRTVSWPAELKQEVTRRG